jgi:signal transduction histidine kinase
VKRSIRTRLAVATAALVAGSAILVLGAVYAATVSGLRRDTESAAHRELDSLLGHWRSGGLGALVGEVRRRGADPASHGFAYLVSEQHSVYIAGNVRAWPEQVPDGASAGPVALEVRRSDVWLSSAYRLESAPLDGKRSLLVGRDASGEADLIAAFQTTALGGLALSLVLAIGAGLAMSRRLLGRVEGMRATIASILGGRKDRRVEVGAAGDEFDELASQFNRLLDENDRLVTQVRDVTNDIAHDLRTPLQRMQGRLESALAAPSTPPEARRVLESFASDSERLLEVFNGLLQLARLESDELRRSMQPVSVETVVREIADLYAPLAEEAGLALRVDVEPRLTITADRQLLAQAISNLIDNALKYGAGGDAIQLDARRAADGVEIAVADHGAGIPEADRERVLGRLVRLDASRGIPGTGLGLSLVAAVARLHGGMLRLEDNQPGVRALLRVRTSPGEAEAASLDSCEAPAPGRIATSARRCISAGCVALPAP